MSGRKKATGVARHKLEKNILEYCRPYHLRRDDYSDRSYVKRQQTPRTAAAENSEYSSNIIKVPQIHREKLVAPQQRRAKPKNVFVGVGSNQRRD
jgi:hypothetical protein